MFYRFLSFLLLACPWPCLSQEISYNRDIRPILSENCFSCHGPDSGSRKAGLRLDRFEDATAANKNGRTAIAPKDLTASEMVARITSTDPDEIMPTPESHKKLTAPQIDTLKKWVEQGAAYEAHWSFLPPARPDVPTASGTDWARVPLDHFIAADLQKAGLTPAPEADRATLARRAALDLTGLPPTPETAASFINDTTPDAWEKYLDRLMSLPEWGEHRARYWLDAARYADTHGIHFDNEREMWHYRQWVINAYNRNLPFDQFTTEQLAGDLLPNRTLDQHIASGFNRCNITTNEGGAISEEYIVLYARDRTETTAQVFMGLTAGCAVCHDHKFDPFSAKDFYSLSAFFNNTTQNAMDGNIKETPPVIFVPQSEDAPRWATLEAEIPELEKRRQARRNEASAVFDQWLAEAQPDAIAKKIPSDALVFHAPLNESGGDKFTITTAAGAQAIPCPTGVGALNGPLANKALRVEPESTLAFPKAESFEHNRPFSYGAWIHPPKKNSTGAVIARMAAGPEHRGWDIWLQDDRPATHFVHRWPDDAIKVTSKKRLAPKKWHHVFFTYDGSGKADGIRLYVDGEPQPLDIEIDALKSTIANDLSFKLGRRESDANIDNIGLQDVRLYDRALAPHEVAAIPRSPELAAILAKPITERSAEEKESLFAWWLNEHDQPSKDLAAQMATLEQERNALRIRGAVTHVMQEKAETPEAFVLARGDYSQRGEKVHPATPASLPAMPAEAPKNRLGLAQWLLAPAHPLTTRVTANRIWQEIFGTGIVRTTGDFGISGELPSNQALLDWLAVEFREQGWDQKRFYKMILNSATYRQSAAASQESLAKDPANRLHSRGPRYRMDAEMIRDYALGASGILHRQLGGPSVRPYQPDGVWEAVAMIGSNTRDYVRDSGSKLYRRSLYTFWKRSAPPASMDIFNAPARETCTVRRERTNTPLQALVTLNDVQFIEAARFLAERTLKESGPTTEARLDFLAQRILIRSLRPSEATVLTASYEEILKSYTAEPAAAAALLTEGEHRSAADLNPIEVATWTMMANQLLNLDEVVCK
jgi:hypothetical protein